MKRGVEQENNHLPSKITVYCQSYPYLDNTCGWKGSEKITHALTPNKPKEVRESIRVAIYIGRGRLVKFRDVRF